VVHLFKAGITELQKQPLLSNGCETRNSGVNVGNGVFRTVRAEATQREGVRRRQLEEYEFGVRWPPACEDVSPGAEKRPMKTQKSEKI
jgi:hypothetical protein